MYETCNTFPVVKLPIHHRHHRLCLLHCLPGGSFQDHSCYKSSRLNDNQSVSSNHLSVYPSLKHNRVLPDKQQTHHCPEP